MHSLEDLTDMNIAALKDISSKGRITLMDTSVFLNNVPENEGIIHGINKHPKFIDPKIINNYSLYLYKLIDCIYLDDLCLTVPEIIDEELVRIRRIFKKRKKDLKSLFPFLKEDINPIKNIEDIINHLNNIVISFEALNEILSNNVIYQSLLQNQFARKIYEEYKKLVNWTYNNFQNKENVGVCADDGLIAASLILLQRLKKPVNIISSDTGVFRRLKIINSLIFHFRKETEESLFYKNLRELLNSKCIFLYSNLNGNKIYSFHGKTKGMEITYRLVRDEKGDLILGGNELEYNFNKFTHMIEKIYCMEQRYSKYIKL